MDNIISQLTELKAQIDELMARIDVAGKARRADELESIASESTFWNDPDGHKYHDAYFARFDNVWCHGDYVEVTERGGVIIYGRSDAVLNPGGVRIGTAEIYRQVEQLEEVVEAPVMTDQFS